MNIRFAFKEMGLLGNPFRQYMNFDFENMDGSMAAHNSVWSQGKIAELAVPGDLKTPKQYLVVVTAQKGAIRLGGYYEIEITGAVHFDGNAAVGGGVKAKQSESLVHPMQGSLVTPSGPLVSPSNGPLVKPGGGPLVTPSAGPLVRPSQPLIVTETPHETRLTLAADVLFDFDSAVLRSEAKPELHRVANLLQEKARGLVLVEGHTDSKGMPAKNTTLSQARAMAVRTWLVTNERLPQGMFNVRGFGATRPIAANTKPDGSDDPEGRQKNRRVELIIAK
jgi:outer membrane protein OmpA-like peptidoglycan-associated protein